MADTTQFPQTDDPELVGFIARSGEWLSLAECEGWVEAPYASARTIHHAEAAMVILGQAPDSYEDAEDALQDGGAREWLNRLYEETGLIRVYAHNEAVGIDIRAGITTDQVASLHRLIAEYEAERVDVDTFDAAHKLIDSDTATNRLAINRAIRNAVAQAA